MIFIVFADTEFWKHSRQFHTCLITPKQRSVISLWTRCHGFKNSSISILSGFNGSCVHGFALIIMLALVLPVRSPTWLLCLFLYWLLSPPPPQQRPILNGILATIYQPLGMICPIVCVCVCVYWHVCLCSCLCFLKITFNDYNTLLACLKTQSLTTLEG